MSSGSHQKPQNDFQTRSINTPRGFAPNKKSTHTTNTSLSTSPATVTSPPHEPSSAPSPPLPEEGSDDPRSSDYDAYNSDASISSESSYTFHVLRNSTVLDRKRPEVENDTPCGVFATRAKANQHAAQLTYDFTVDWSIPKREKKPRTTVDKRGLLSAEWSHMEGRVNTRVEARRWDAKTRKRVWVVMVNGEASGHHESKVAAGKGLVREMRKLEGLVECVEYRIGEGGGRVEMWEDG